MVRYFVSIISYQLEICCVLCVKSLGMGLYKCCVEQFYLEVRDSKYIVHKATSSIAKFSGPATDKIDKFGYTIKIDDAPKVSPGRATLLAHIRYKCPEGEVLMNYPDHANLTFEIGVFK